MKLSLTKSAFAVAAAFASTATFAAGFQLTEQSSLGLGRAYAGAGIVGDDLSAVHYNPAGMTLLSGSRIQAGGVWIAVDAPFKGKDGTEENGRLKGQMIPAGYITRQVTDQLWFGFGMTVPFGMGTEYNDNWNHSYSGTNSKIYTFDMNPNFAYKVNDFISIGGGVSVQYAKAELGFGVPSMMHADVEGDSWDWGYNLGIMISPTDKLRFGLSYRSAIEHEAEGTTEISGVLPFGPATIPVSGLNLATDVTIKTPDTVMLTGTWEATDALRLSGLIRWAKWSNFETLTLNAQLPGINIPGGSSIPAGNMPISIENDWEDTWLFSVGADYRMNSNWTVRGGIAYEKDPIDDQKTRMAVIPDTDRLWLSLGASYNYNDKLQFDVGAAYLMGIGDKDIYGNKFSGPYDGQKTGEYDSLDCYMVGVQMQYRF